MPGSQGLKNTVLKPISVADPGGGGGAWAPAPPPVFFDPTDFFGVRAPLFSKGLDDLPPPRPYLKVWIRHCV